MSAPFCFLRLSAVSLSAAILLAVPETLEAQEDTPVYATGAVPAPRELLDSLPTTPEFRSYLPQAISLSDRMPEAGNQGAWGSCVSWAVGYAARSYYERAAYGRQISRPNNLVSPGWLHGIIRVDPNDCSRGALVVKGLEQLKRGAVSMTSYPYDTRRCEVIPASEAQQVSEFRIRDYRTVSTTDLDQIRGQLASGHPVVFAARLNREFMSDRGKSTWRASPDQGEFTGNHAMTLTGYDDRDGVFTFINSWGTAWGQAGFGKMTYDTFKARAFEAFVIEPTAPPIRPRPLEPDPPPRPQVKVLTDPQLECAQVVERTDQSRPALDGFVGSEEDLEALRTRFGESHDIEVELRPWPQCEALLILTQGRLAEDGPEIEIPKTAYREGDLFSFAVVTPDFDTHLHLSYFQADGSVVHLSQSAGDRLVTLLPRQQVMMGDGEDGRPAFQVSGPFGNEMLLAITTKSPLFTEARPQVEDERDFLSALRAATIEFEDDGAGRYYASRSVAITTRGDTE